MDYFIDAFKQYAVFTGRATRKQYWMFILFYMIFYLAAAIIDAVIGTAILSTIITLALLIPSISIATRRLHDIGRSGWWQLVILVPVIGLIVLLFFLIQDSHDENEYGPNPKSIQTA